MEYINRASKDPRRQWQGHVNRSTGDAFELLIRASCEYYRMRRWANIEKTPEPFKPVSGVHPKGRMMVFDCIAERKGQPDFKGTLKGGRSICFEAKTADSDRIDQSVVLPHQREALEFHHELGAAVYVFVALRLQDFYRVPWETWRQMKELYGRKFMTRADLEPFRITVGNVLKIIDEVS